MCYSIRDQHNRDLRRGRQAEPHYRCQCGDGDICGLQLPSGWHHTEREGHQTQGREMQYRRSLSKSGQQGIREVPSLFILEIGLRELAYKYYVCVLD